MAGKAKLIDNKQIQLIHVAKGQLKIDEDTYREMLKSHCKVNSSKELTYRQAELFISVLKKKGFKFKRRGGSRTAQKTKYTGAKRLSGAQRTGIDEKVVTLATKGEIQKIEALVKCVEWKYEDGFRRWHAGRMKIENIRTSQEAYVVIEGLKKMIENQEKALAKKSRGVL